MTELDRPADLQPADLAQILSDHLEKHPLRESFRPRYTTLFLRPMYRRRVCSPDGFITDSLGIISHHNRVALKLNRFEEAYSIFFEQDGNRHLEYTGVSPSGQNIEATLIKAAYYLLHHIGRHG